MLLVVVATACARQWQAYKREDRRRLLESHAESAVSPRDLKEGDVDGAEAAGER